MTGQYYLSLVNKALLTHSSVLAWRIPGMEEPGGLLSVGSHRVGHDCSDLAAAAAAAVAYGYAHYYFEQPKQNTHMQINCKSYVGFNLFSKKLV